MKRLFHDRKFGKLKKHPMSNEIAGSDEPPSNHGPGVSSERDIPYADDIETDSVDMKKSLEIVASHTGHISPVDVQRDLNQVQHRISGPVYRQNQNDQHSDRSRDSGISLTSNLSTLESINRFDQSDLHTKYRDCPKNPKHEQFIPVYMLNTGHLPEDFRNQKWLNLIQLKADDVVQLTVRHTASSRPDDLGFKDVTSARYGSGTAFIYNMENSEPCNCSAGPPGHSVSGVFRVMTASHVVFDDEEAKNTEIHFFYNSIDPSTVVRAWGERVCFIDVERNRSIIECRTHELTLFQKLKESHKQRNELIEKYLEKEAGNSQMAVLISHPHGKCKQVSIGKLLDKTIVGPIRTTKENIHLADCFLTYDTPTCPGTGGGPVNIFGGGTASCAFAPHCASKTNGENISGLGWARVFPGSNGDTTQNP